MFEPFPKKVFAKIHNFSENVCQLYNWNSNAKFKKID